ncbi:MAG: hypothetical protein KKE94_13585 [Gammaproteobacteria bacterium]|nr:hypothetical protein [Gammaproteobacteria bacterium]
MRKLSAVLLLTWLVPATAADNLSCIQAPARLKACPHLLYRVAQLPAMPAPALICICATDFAALLKPAVTDSEKVQQNMARRQMQVIYGEKLQPVLDILQRRL